MIAAIECCKNPSFVIFFLVHKGIQFFFIRPPGNKAYLLQMPSVMVSVYCHMSGHGLGACGGGGWTLVMKTDGNKVSCDNQLVFM